MTASLRRVLVALHKPANAMGLVIYTMAIIDKMTGNPWFPAPFPPLAKVRAAMNVLSKAEVASRSRTKGLSDERNSARGVLVNLLEQLRAYVEGVANENPDQARAIIESAAMDMVAARLPRILPFRVKQGRVSGTVQLYVKAGPKGSSYDFQMSADGGKTWIDLPSRMQANTTVPNLTPGATYFFRYRILLRKGAGDWSEAISIVVQ
jgi:hypothetical protein